MHTFPITEKAIAHLSAVDFELGAFIKQRGKIRRSVFHSSFECLVSCVIAQQIASSVADKIFKRVQSVSEVINAKNILSLGENGLCACGISAKKAETILSLAQAFTSGELSEAKFKNMSDAEIEKKLVTFSGIGAWTVEMFLIFALAREDVFSVKDFGIRKGFSILHEKEDISKYKSLYSPYGTTASIYYWEIASNV